MMRVAQSRWNVEASICGLYVPALLDVLFCRRCIEIHGETVQIFWIDYDSYDDSSMCYCWSCQKRQLPARANI